MEPCSLTLKPKLLTASLFCFSKDYLLVYMRSHLWVYEAKMGLWSHYHTYCAFYTYMQTHINTYIFSRNIYCVLPFDVFNIANNSRLLGRKHGPCLRQIVSRNGCNSVFHHSCLLQWDSVNPLISRWSLFTLTLNLAWWCALLCSIEYSRSDILRH